MLRHWFYSYFVPLSSCCPSVAAQINLEILTCNFLIHYKSKYNHSYTSDSLIVGAPWLALKVLQLGHKRSFT